DGDGEPLPDGAVARFGTMRFRHWYMLQSVVISDDGKLLVTAGTARGVCLWDTATGRLLRRIPSQTLHLDVQVALSRDAKTLAILEGESIKVVETSSGREISKIAQK